MNNGNVLSQRDCCSNRVCTLNRIIGKRGFTCNDSTKAFKIVEVIKESEAWFKKIREGIAFNKACTKFYPYRFI